MKKRIVSIALACVMTVSFTACGKDESKESNQKAVDITAAEVITKMADASADNTEIDSTVEMNLEFVSEEVENKMSGKMDIKAKTDPTEAYLNLDLSVDIGDEKEEQNFEAYVMSEDDEEFKMYLGIEGQWISTTMSMEDFGLEADELTEQIEFSKYITEENIDKYFSDVKVEEKKVDKKDCYSVTGDIKEEAIEDLFALADESLLEDVDLSGFDFSMEICADKDTCKPASFTVNVASNDKSEVEIKDFTISIKYNSFEVDDITLPEDAENAQDAGSLLDLIA